MKNRFNFSKAEKVGVAVLSLVILFFLIVLNIPRHSFIPNLLVEDTSEIEYIQLEKKGFHKKFSDTESKPFNQRKIVYKEFNPNNYSKKDWIRIGFSEKQAAVILNYKEQINRFKSKDDLVRCFVISNKKFKELEPFLIFEKPEEEEELFEEEKLVALPVIELNQSSQANLETVNGIGPFFAEKIIEHGKKLGGYAHVSQVKEIYGMTEENFDRIVNQLSVNASLISSINLIEANFEQLKQHPYLNWKQSQVLVSLLNKVVDEDFWNSLSENVSFSKDDISKLKPYLK